MWIHFKMESGEPHSRATYIFMTWQVTSTCCLLACHAIWKWCHISPLFSGWAKAQMILSKPDNPLLVMLYLSFPAICFFATKYNFQG